MPPKKNAPKKSTSTTIKPTTNNEHSNSNSNSLTNAANTAAIPSSSSSSSNVNSLNNVNTKINRSKHQTTESAEDLSGKSNIEILTMYTQRLKELEQSAIKLRTNGNTIEANIFFNKAKQTKYDIEMFLKDTNDKKAILDQQIENDYEIQIQKLIDTNFSNPSARLIEQARIKGLDLNKPR